MVTELFIDDKAWRRFLRLMSKSKSVGAVRDVCWEGSRKNYKKEDLVFETFECCLSDHREQGIAFETTFQLERQKRIACDFWQHVLTTKSRSSFNFLFNAAWGLYDVSLKQASEERELAGYERNLLSVLNELPRAGKVRGTEILSLLRELPVPTPSGTLDVKLFSEVVDHMLRILLRLDYHKQLTKAITSKTPKK
jgi:hypothetical protein